MKKLIWSLLLFFVSCKAASGIDEDKTFILINGVKVEMVADEFGNQYLKEFVADGRAIYIPFPFETEEVADTLHSYEAKLK